MSRAFPASIETLALHHDRRAFSCGAPDLDDYLRRFARQHAKTKISRTYVAADGKRILGFYSLGLLP